MDVQSILTYGMFAFIESRVFSTKHQKENTMIPSDWIRPIWVIALVLVAICGYLYDNQYLFAIYAANIILSKIWIRVFFIDDINYMGTALFIAVLVMLSASAFLATIVVDGAWTIVYIYSVYAAWTLFVAFLNYRLFMSKQVRNIDLPTQNARSRVVKKKKLSRTLDINF